MEQVNKFEFETRGATADEIFNGHELAIEAWGPRAKFKDSAMVAMAYLWRRFGPPWQGSDPHKSLADYILTTADAQVFLWLHLSGSGLAYSVGYLVHESIHEEYDRPRLQWWRDYKEWWLNANPKFRNINSTEVSEAFQESMFDDSIRERAVEAIGAMPRRGRRQQWQSSGGIIQRVNQAVFDAMRELEKPVYVRDCAINIWGRCDDMEEYAEKSKYAGYGVPKKAMDQLIESE